MKLQHAFLLMVSLFLLTLFLPRLAQAQSPSPAPISMTCQATITKVADNYKLPYKNDGYQLDPHSARLTVGDSFIYSFKIFAPNNTQRISIQHVILSHAAGVAAPLTVLQIGTPNGQCATSTTNQSVCDLNYSFVEEVDTPIYFLMKTLPTPQTEVASMFTIDTDAGQVSCVGEINVTPADSQSSSFPTATAVSTSPMPSPIPSLMPSHYPYPTTQPSTSPIPAKITYPVTSPDAQTQKQLQTLQGELQGLQTQVNSQAQVQQAQQEQQSQLVKTVNEIKAWLKKIFPFAFK